MDEELKREKSTLGKLEFLVVLVLEEIPVGTAKVKRIEILDRQSLRLGSKDVVVAETKFTFGSGWLIWS